MQQAFPEANYVGQDISQQMVDFARTRLGNVYCQDAHKPVVGVESVDFLFSRFLNSEVVTSKQALDLATVLWGTVKPGGYMILFGHTPVLVPASLLEKLGGVCLQRNGAAPGMQSVFQYYVFKKVSF